MPFSWAFAITMPASTPATAPVRDPKDIPAGAVIDDCRLHVPSGHKANVPVWVEIESGKWLPTDGTEYRLDNVPDLQLLRRPYRVPRSTRLTFAGYNLDTVSQHVTRLFVAGRYKEEVPELEARTLA